MPCRNVSLRDGKQAGESCLRSEQIVTAWIEAIVGKGIADGQEFPLRIEEKREVHCKRHLARRVGERMQSVLQLRRCIDDLKPVTAMFGHGFGQGLDPENQIRGAVVCGCGYVVVRRFGGFFSKSLQRRQQCLGRLRSIQMGFDLFEDGDELPSMLAPRRGQGVAGFTYQPNIVCDAKPNSRRKRGIHPLLAGVGEHDQMTGEISAIDR